MTRERGAQGAGKPMALSLHTHTHPMVESTDQHFHGSAPECRAAAAGLPAAEMMLAQWVTAINSLFLKSAY
jgi:hypothetical protein